MKKTWKLEDLDCAHCAQKMQDAVAKIEGVQSVCVNFLAARMTIEADEDKMDAVFAEALHDKKRAGDTIDLVIPHDIGRCSIDRTPLSTFHDLIAEGLGQKGDASAC